MDGSENQPARSSKTSESGLPRPLGNSRGLAECSASQQNSRIPKREVSQAAPQPDAKRKLLAERAVEYSHKPTPSTANPPPSVTGRSYSAMFQSQNHSRKPTSQPSSSSGSSFAKSCGPGRNPSTERHSAANNGGRPGHARSKSQAPRSRTAHGHRDEEHRDGASTNSGRPQAPSDRLRGTPSLLQVPKVRGTVAMPLSSASRESSLTTKFAKLKPRDHSTRDPSQVTPQCSANGFAAQVVSSSMSVSRSGKSKDRVVSPRKPTDEQIKSKLDKVQRAMAAIKSSASAEKAPSPPVFLTKDSNLTAYTAWDVDGRVNHMESEFKELRSMLNDTLTQKRSDDDAYELARARVSELEDSRQRLEERQEKLKEELSVAKDDGRQLRHELEKQQWDHGRTVDDLERRHREAVEDLERQQRENFDNLQRQHRTTADDLRLELKRVRDQEMKELQERIEALARHHQQELDDERRRMDKEVREVRTRMSHEHQDMDLALQGKDREVQQHRSRAESLQAELERDRLLKGSLQTSIAELSASNTTLEAKINSLKSHVEFLESDNKAQSDSFASMEARLQEALRIADEVRKKLIKEETERRILFNKYQELKGNIRVMCRVRPVLDGSEGEEARMSFPDDKTSAEILLAGPEERSSLGTVTRKNYPFEFDRVFAPGTQNDEIFGEISQLVQSALDGYNVCIFCYGQTGSGKTYTMSSDDGMIPRATHMIYETMTKLKDKSWEYRMEGSFVEVYNEDLNDLLSPAHERRSSEGKPRKLEIRHDEARRQTAILNCKSVHLNSASSVERILQEAQRNRSVAATKANERSSRSHSVFVLKLVGENSATGERCEGTLNLVDLAGSERLKQSQAEGERMKETQSINKSLSCLGDVIEALGRGSGHVPYRNSKLTHLLQYSLGGNSKTLMFVMVSPLEVHLKETLTSLRFATKVHNTHIGTAKATKKLKGVES